MKVQALDAKLIFARLSLERQQYDALWCECRFHCQKTQLLSSNHGLESPALAFAIDIDLLVQ
jgi:hypothetical protein